jgi:phage tail-like protein
MAGHGTSAGRYIIEFDGISAMRSTSVTGVGEDHDEFELYESNKVEPNLGRGHFKCGDVTIKHAHALNGTDSEAFAWFRQWRDGGSIERRGGRLIVLDEDGQSPVRTYQLLRCVPKKFAPENQEAGSKEANFFTFVFRPESMDVE